jgi:hypothetical protein
MTLLTPPGYSAGGMSGRSELQDSHFFFNGEHRFIGIGSGPGPLYIMQDRTVSENGECETMIAGRRVVITVYNWVVEDNKPHDARAPSTFLLRIDAGDRGLHYIVLPASGCAQ